MEITISGFQGSIQDSVTEDDLYHNGYDGSTIQAVKDKHRLGTRQTDATLEITDRPLSSLERKTCRLWRLERCGLKSCSSLMAETRSHILNTAYLRVWLSSIKT